MTREQVLAFISQLDPEIINAISQSNMSIEEFIESLNPYQDNTVGFEVQRTKIAEGIYFEHNKTEVVERNGQLGTIRTDSVWDCGHSQQTHKFGGIDSFGHCVCEECLRQCRHGHLCCVMDSKDLPDGTTVCDCHTGIWSFFDNKFEKWRVR